MGVAYAKRTEAESDLVRLTQEEREAVIDRLERASRVIDTELGVPEEFYAPAGEDAADLVVIGTGERFIYLPPHIRDSVESVTGPDGEPLAGYSVAYTEYGLRLYLAGSAPFLADQAYTVRARWGFARVPGQITEACLMLAVRLVDAKDKATADTIGETKRADKGDYPMALIRIFDAERRRLRRMGWLEDETVVVESVSTISDEDRMFMSTAGAIEPTW